MRNVVLAASLALALFASAVNAQSEGLSVGQKAPEITGNQWINSKPLSLKDLRGHVVLLHFWTFGCINCRHNLPLYKKLQSRFAAKGVRMIGVHTPEGDFEKPFANVKAATRRLGVSFPVLHDPDARNWDAYHQQFWPQLYVIDQKGVIRGVWIGELNYEGADGEREVENLVDKLLKG